MMIFAYNYRAKARGERLVSGMVLARGQDVAVETLRANGLTPIAITMSLNYTIEASRRKGFDNKSLALFYDTLASQFDSGVLEQLILGATEFIHDRLLATALETLAQRLAFRGGSLGDEMLACGFPPTHCAAIESAAAAGKIPEVLKSLAADCQRNAEIAAEVGVALRFPAIASIFMIGLIWASLMFLAPLMMKMWVSMSSVQSRARSEGLVMYMNFVEWAGDHRILFTVLYFGAFTALACIILSPPVRRLILKIPKIKRLRERSEMLRQWSLWTALYEAGENASVASKKLIGNCDLEESRRSFTSLARLLEDGYPVADAVKRSKFPRYIESGVTASFKRNDGPAAGLNMMVNRLGTEVALLARELKQSIQHWAPWLIGAGLVLIAVAVYLPNMAMIGSVLKYGAGQ